MGLAEMKHEARLADLEMAIRHLQDAGVRLIAAREHEQALKVAKLVKHLREIADVG